MIIPAKFGQIQTVVKEEMSFEQLLMTTDGGHPIITIAHHEPLKSRLTKMCR